VTAYLVRHADAVGRHSWAKDDELRPLSEKGTRQADALVDVLGDNPITRVLTSPAVRCRQTVEPLAERLGVSVEDVGELREGMPLDRARALLDALAGEDVVLCSHGDLIPDLVNQLIGEGMEARGGRDCKKGSTWVLEARNGRFRRARYLPAP
jgi:phosphohistidine phosphatase SixA